jgi:hypothetical protein
MEALMRHLGSIVLCLLLGPIIYVLAGVGLGRLAQVPRDWYRTDPRPIVIGLVLLAAAGILYAVLLLVRLSPLGPVPVGLGYLGLTAWGLLRTDSLTTLIPERPGRRARGGRRYCGRPLSSCRAITIRCTWLVPS